MDRFQEIAATVTTDCEEREGLVRALGEYTPPRLEAFDVEEAGSDRRW